MIKAFVFSIVGLSLSLAAPGALAQQPAPKPAPVQIAQAKAPVSKDVPAEMQTALEKLQSARADLNKAGGEWGGFREQAIANVNQAIENVNKAMDYYRKNKK